MNKTLVLLYGCDMEDPLADKKKLDSCLKGIIIRAVIKRRGPGIFPGYYERGPRLLSKENGRKIERKKSLAV